MKGAVFTIFEDMVVEQFGLLTWDRLLSAVAPDSEGIYTASDSYPDAELFELVGGLSAMTGQPVQTLVQHFGRYALGRFAELYPDHFRVLTPKQFLMSVDRAIHVEVLKLYPDALLPAFEYEDPAPSRLVMLYRSPRKLCSFAEGLIEGTSRHFATPIRVEHPLCMHRGDEHCRLEIEFG